MRQIVNHFTDDDLYKLTTYCAVIDNYPRAHACHQFVDHDDTVYPEGFAREMEHQTELPETVVTTDEEINFLRQKCNYLPEWFLVYLRGSRFSYEWMKVWQDEDRHLHIEFEGLWVDTILLEVKALIIISELFYMFNDQAQGFDYQELYDRTYHKMERSFEVGCVFSDLGTRRRASLTVEDIIARAIKDCYDSRGWKGRFVGTSNIHLAMKYSLMPVDTMAHESTCVIGGIFGPQVANYMVMEARRRTYRDALGTHLYGPLGWDIFSHNFSEDFTNQFKRLRIDSGDNFGQLEKIIAKYNSFGIDARDKQVLSSNALDTDKAIEIQCYAEGRAKSSFGIGTRLINDFPYVKLMSIAIKLIAVKITEPWPSYNKTCEIPEDKGKHIGKPEAVKRFMEAVNYKEQISI